MFYLVLVFLLAVARYGKENGTSPHPPPSYSKFYPHAASPVADVSVSGWRVAAAPRSLFSQERPIYFLQSYSHNNTFTKIPTTISPRIVAPNTDLKMTSDQSYSQKMHPPEPLQCSPNVTSLASTENNELFHNIRHCQERESFHWKDL